MLYFWIRLPWEELAGTPAVMVAKFECGGCTPRNIPDIFFLMALFWVVMLIILVL